MSVDVKEQIQEYTFRLFLSRRDADRFERYINENGYKKKVIVQKAITEYLDRHEKDQG